MDPRLIADARKRARKSRDMQVKMISKTDHPKVIFVSHKAGLTDHACPNKHISNCMVDYQVHGALTTTKLSNVNNVCNGILCHSNSFHATVSQVMDSHVQVHPVCISLC